MEMQKLVKAEEKKEDDAPREPMLEDKAEKNEDKGDLSKPGEAEADPYSKLGSPSEDVYAEAFYGDSPAKPKAGKQPEGNIRLYRAVCLFLTLICLALLAAIIILSVKTQTGSKVCPEAQKSARAETSTAFLSSPCSYEKCKAQFPTIEPKQRSCKQCADGWLTLDESCFFLSTFRLSWDESQKNCSARGGSLAVISSPTVQYFLATRGKMFYWIGLRRQSNTWTWVNNTVLQESYWKDGSSDKDCGILSGGELSNQNWITAGCSSYTYFICQLQM